MNTNKKNMIIFIRLININKAILWVIWSDGSNACLEIVKQRTNNQIMKMLKGRELKKKRKEKMKKDKDSIYKGRKNKKIDKILKREIKYKSNRNKTELIKIKRDKRKVKKNRKIKINKIKIKRKNNIIRIIKLMIII